MTYKATPLDRNPCPVGNDLYNLVDPSFVIITLYLNFLIPETRVDKKKRRNIAFLQVLVDPSLVIISIYFVCLNHAPE